MINLMILFPIDFICWSGSCLKKPVFNWYGLDCINYMYKLIEHVVTHTKKTRGTKWQDTILFFSSYVKKTNKNNPG